MKTICLDLRALQIGHENRGIGMVVKSVLNNLDDDTNDYLFYIFDSSNPIKDMNIDLKMKNYRFVKTPKLKTTVDNPKDLIDSFKLSHHRFSALRQYKPDVFLQFDFALGLPKWHKTKTLCIGYDLIPLIMRTRYLPSPITIWNQGGGKKSRIKGMIRAVYYQLKARKSYSNYKYADKILCISNATKQSFVDILRISPDNLATLALAPVIAEATSMDEKSHSKISKPYVFYIGGTDSRKNVADVVYAFNIARGRGYDIALVLAGNEFKKVNHIPDTKARNAILNSPYGEDIHLAGFVSDEEKNDLYKHALAFVFCSSYEGFGLPVLEAQAMGCPVITYSNSSIPEVASKSVLLVENGDFTSIAKSIRHVASGDRRKIVKEGLEFAKEFTWSRYVSSLVKHF